MVLKIKDKVLCTDTGAGSESWLRDHVDEYGPYTIQTYDGVSDAFLDVQAGRCDGAVTDAPGVDWYVKDFPDTLEEDGSRRSISGWFCLPPRRPLIAKFNEALQSMKKDKFIAETYKKYYGVYPPENSSAYTIYENSICS